EWLAAARPFGLRGALHRRGAPPAGRERVARREGARPLARHAAAEDEGGRAALTLVRTGPGRRAHCCRHDEAPAPQTRAAAPAFFFEFPGHSLLARPAARCLRYVPGRRCKRMYESLGVAIIPNLHAEGLALMSDLTVVGAVWLALCVITCLAIVTV